MNAETLPQYCTRTVEMHRRGLALELRLVCRRDKTREGRMSQASPGAIPTFTNMSMHTCTLRMKKYA